MPVGEERLDPAVLPVRQEICGRRHLASCDDAGERTVPRIESAESERRLGGRKHGGRSYSMHFRNATPRIVPKEAVEVSGHLCWQAYGAIPAKNRASTTRPRLGIKSAPFFYDTIRCVHILGR
jgi:hypothetical protein